MSHPDDGPFLTLADVVERDRRATVGHAYGAQCLMCKHQLSRGNLVRGCLRFEDSKLDADTSTVLAALIFKLAGSMRCVAFEKLEYGPDAYRALDLPEKDA